MFIEASGIAVEADLHQKVNQNWQPLSFFSKQFNPAQWNYPIYDRKLVAYLSINYFRVFLKGRLFALFADHKTRCIACQRFKVTRHVRKLVYSLGQQSAFPPYFSTL